MTNSFGRTAALRAAFFVTVSTYISYGISIVVGAIVARALGPAVYGQYAYIIWLTGVLVILANNGLTTSGIRFVSESLGRDRLDQAGRLYAWLYRRQIASVALVLALFAAWAIWLPTPQWQMNLTQFLLIVSVCVYAKTLYIFKVSIAKGHGNFRIDPYTTTLSSVLSGTAALLLAWRHAGVLSYVLLFVVTSVGIAVFGSWLLRRHGIRREPGAVEPSLLIELRRHLFWTTVLAVSVGLGMRSIETYILASKFGPEPVAFYTVAGGLMRGSAELLTVGLSAVLMPAMSHAYGGGGVERVRPIFSDSLRYLTFLGLLLAGAGALCADPVVRVIYGTKYLPMIPVLQAMLICTGITLSEATTGTLLTTTGRQRDRASIVVGNFFVAITLALLLVPRYGLMGATMSYVITRVIYSIVVGIHALHSTGTPLPGVRLLRLLLAAAAAGAAALGVVEAMQGIIRWIVSAALYSVLLVLLSILLRAWTPRDVDMAISFSASAPRALAWTHPLFQMWRRRLTH